MCNFCENIYPDKDTQDIVFGRGKYSNFNDENPFITIDEEGCYDINVNPGDPYEIGIIVNIKYCPYCGHNLTESESKRYMEIAKSYVQGLRAGLAESEK